MTESTSLDGLQNKSVWATSGFFHRPLNTWCAADRTLHLHLTPRESLNACVQKWWIKYLKNVKCCFFFFFRWEASGLCFAKLWIKIQIQERTDARGWKHSFVWFVARVQSLILICVVEVVFCLRSALHVRFQSATSCSAKTKLRLLFSAYISAHFGKLAPVKCVESSITSFYGCAETLKSWGFQGQVWSLQQHL